MTKLIKYLTILGIWVLVKGRHETNSKEKRILLNDPSYIQQQFDHLQSEFQDLLVKVNGQQNTITSQQLQLQDLHAKVDSQQNTIASQQTTIKDLDSKLLNSSTSVAILQSKLASQSERGVSFIRWGRKACPGNFSLVYTGYAGGSLYAHRGGAVNFICMPHDPIWGPNKNKPTDKYGVGYVYGAEYQSPSVYGVADYMEDVPCAFCHSAQYSTHAMIPGRTACYPGWTEAYHGDMAGGRITDAAGSEFVCVDQHPEVLDGGAEVNNDGKLFYGVKTKCGSLRCPPYEDEKYLSCVVCVK